MVARNLYKPRYKIAYQAKSKVWPYKNSRLRRFFNIRGRKLVRRGLFKRIVLVFNNMKWTVARRYIRPFMKKRRPLKRRFKTAFYSKQQLRAFYGKEKEEIFRNFFKSFSGGVKNRGRIFTTGLESRADVFLYRLRFLPTIYACRQFIHYFGLRLNRGLEHAPSARIIPGDTITFKQEYWEIFKRSLRSRLFWRAVGLKRWKKRELKRLRKKLWSLNRNKAFTKKNLAVLVKRRYVFKQLMLTVAVFHPFYKQFLNKLNNIYKELYVTNDIVGLDGESVDPKNYLEERFKKEEVEDEDSSLDLIPEIKELTTPFLYKTQIKYFNIQKTLEDLVKTQNHYVQLDTVWNMPYNKHQRVIERVAEIQRYEQNKAFYITIWTQFIKKKLVALWVLFKVNFDKLIEGLSEKNLIRNVNKVYQRWEMSPKSVYYKKYIKYRDDRNPKKKKFPKIGDYEDPRAFNPFLLKSLKLEETLIFINWIFKAYKFLYYYQSQFVELEHRYHIYLSWLSIRPIYEKQELLTTVIVNIIKQLEGIRSGHETSLYAKKTPIEMKLVAIRNITGIDQSIEFWKLICKEVLLQLLAIKDQFSKEIYLEKKRIFSKTEYIQATQSIKIIREKLLSNRIKRFIRKPKIVKDRFTGKIKKLRAPVWKFRLKRRSKARRRRNIARYRKVHLYIPSYIYLDVRTLRAVYLYHPKPEEINFGFRCSLKGLQAFYSSAGY